MHEIMEKIRLKWEGIFTTSEVGSCLLWGIYPLVLIEGRRRSEREGGGRSQRIQGKHAKEGKKIEATSSKKSFY